MSTSSSINFNVTRNDIITDALSEVGAYDPGEGLKSEDVTLCARRLNTMVKSWNTRPFLYTIEEFSHTLTPGTESYTIGSGGDIDRDRPVRITRARREDSNGNEVPISVVSRQEYKDLPTKDTQSAPNIVYYDPQLELGVLYVWPTGDTNNKILHLVTQRQIEDFDSASNNPDVPKEAYLALYLNLAVNIWRVYNPNSPIPQDLFLRAEQALSDYGDHESEGTSIFIMPSYEGRY